MENKIKKAAGAGGIETKLPGEEGLNQIKVKDNARDIRVLDKPAMAAQKMKQATVRVKDEIPQTASSSEYTEDSPEEYAENKVQHGIIGSTEKAVHEIREISENAVERGRKHFQDSRKESLRRKNTRIGSEENAELVRIRTADYGKANRGIKTPSRMDCMDGAVKEAGQIVKESNRAVRSAKRNIKCAEQTTRMSVKTAEKSAEVSQRTAGITMKTSQKATELMKQAAVTAYKGVAELGKAAATTGKAIAAGVSKLVSLIAAAGGGIAVIIVAVLCVIALIFTSSFGIFASGEKQKDGQTMRQVVQEINQEYMDKLDQIKNANEYDELELSGSRAVWPEVLSVYAVKTTTDPNNPDEVATITNKKKKILTDIFWKMNEISYSTEIATETELIETDDGEGNIITKEQEKKTTTLYITVSHKTADQMAEICKFDDEQNRQLTELLTDENDSMWSAVLYGIYDSNEQIVQVALSQVGNVGGEPYWSWYGFSSHVEWCACFVSWCADQCGYLETGIMPKYAQCVNGVDWFQTRGQWADNSVSPQPGMIIFFDWDVPDRRYGPQDGKADHTGIVEKVENGIIYTVEGNAQDVCRKNQYPVGWYQILGYGALEY